MTPERGLPELTRCLSRLGVRTAYDAGGLGLAGFPLVLPTASGDLVLDLPTPPLLDGLDPARIGLAMLDPLGECRAAWGLAERVAAIRRPDDERDEAFRAIVRRARLGEAGTERLGNYRWHYALLRSGAEPAILLLVTDASEEGEVGARANVYERAATVLRVMGAAMAVEGDVPRLCASVVHELAVSANLAAALVWTAVDDGRALRLQASRGITPAGRERLRRLRGRAEDGNAAELAASTRQTQFFDRVLAHERTAACEGRFTLLKPGGAIVLPLTCGDSLVGVLEAIGQERDAWFVESRFLFETVAEHLALAIRAADLLATTQRLATHDPLTGIANHRMLHDFLAQRLAEARREDRPLGVVMVDVDRFRAFNEEEGHATGDIVLKAVAQMLRATVRAGDLAARYGGEEFTLVLPGQDLAAVGEAAERVRRQVEALDLSPHGVARSLTISLGCAGYPETASEVATLLRAADLALYAAKRQGRNRTVVYQGVFRADAAPLGNVEGRRAA